MRTVPFLTVSCQNASSWLSTLSALVIAGWAPVIPPAFLGLESW